MTTSAHESTTPVALLSTPVESRGESSAETPDELADAFLDEAGWFEEDAPGALREIVPPPVNVDAERFEEAAKRHRKKFIRRTTVIALSTVISIGGALLLHSLIGGAFLAALFFGLRPDARLPGAGSRGEAISEGGEGFMMLAQDGEGPAPKGRLDAIGSLAGTPPQPETPALLPSIPEIAPPQAAPPVQVSTLIPSPPTPALEVPSDFGTVAVKPLVRTPVPPPAQELAVTPPDVTQNPILNVPPTPSEVRTQIPQNATAVVNPASRLAGVPGRYGVPDGGDESLPPTFRGGSGRGNGSGRGSGAGTGSGNGIDRGPSGADRPEPVVLDNPMPPAAERPAWMRMNPPTAAVTFRVRVLASGEVSDIQVLASSGRPEVDSYYREVLSKWKFSPAISGGKPVTRTADMSFEPPGI